MVYDFDNDDDNYELLWMSIGDDDDCDADDDDDQVLKFNRSFFFYSGENALQHSLPLAHPRIFRVNNIL